jgi:anionic cell wall polymer biosynthesis LytR-Cps2A-Psr (LCP) family protein
MFGKLLNNFKNKAKRVSNKFSFNRKSRAQHSHFRQENDFSSNNNEDKDGTWLSRLLKKTPRLLISVLVLLSLIALGYHIIQICIALIIFQTKPYTGYSQTAPATVESKFSWQGDTKLTIAFVGTDRVDNEHVFVDALGIYNLDPIDKKLSVFIINPDIKVYVSAVGKEVNLRTVFTDPKLSGDRTLILKNAVAALLAVRVDKYILVDKADFASYSAMMNPVKLVLKQSVKDADTIKLPAKKLASWSNGEQNINGDSFLELLASDENGRNDQLERQQNFFASLPFEQLSLTTFINLPQLVSKFTDTFFTDLSKDELFTILQKAPELKEDSLKKGYTHASSSQKVNVTSFYPVYSPILDRIDHDINNIFFDLKIFKEQARIEVLNSSDVKGLANSRSRWIANLGSRIIKVGNGLGGLAITKIYCTEPEKYPFTINELNRVFNFKAQVVKQDYPNRHMGDIIIELGNTYE